MQSPTSTLTEFYAAIEEGRHGKALDAFLSPDAVTIERPNLLVPGGRVSDRAAMRAASSAGASLLEAQRYDIRWIKELDDTVAVRLTWRGTVTQASGPFAAGQELTAHIAQFVRVDGGLITEIETYDCYEPF